MSARRGGPVPIELATRTFKTKKSATEWIRSVLNGTELGERVDEEHFVDMCALVARHPRAQEKVGAGIDHFEVRPANKSTRCFFLVRTDGSETDFSYRKCLTPSSDAPLLRFKEAARASIDDQIRAFRESAFAGAEPPLCALTGVELENTPETHVDHHEPQFNNLVMRFIAEHTVDVHRDGLIARNTDGEFGARFACTETRDAWCEFHRDNATLRLTTKNSNLTRKRKKQRLLEDG